jgi:predicted membrane protein
MSFWIILHTIGGHYTFELVPFDSINQLFGWERNIYDRIAHFMIGVYAFPIMEYLWRSKAIQQKWLLYTFGICSILAVAGAYEIFEWRFAIIADPKAGLAVLGSQGDIRDAQKDMLMDTLGELLAVFLFIIREKFINKRKAD